ncbi:MAG: MlaD family protein [Acidimicrobiales bacterium]|nr:MlaD family protein [Acidimicrobiales bacterium]
MSPAGLYTRLAVLATAGLACLGFLAVQIGQLGGAAGPLSDTYSVAGEFTDATGLVPGDAVNLAGVRVGKVSSVKVQRGVAVVSMSIDERHPLPAGSTFEVRWRNLLGQRVVEVLPPVGASTDGPALVDGTHLGTDRTQAAADLSMLLNNTEPLVGKLDTATLNRVMATLAAALEGREDTIGQAIGDGSDLVATLAPRAAAIQRSVTNLSQLVQGIAEHDEEVERFLISFASTAEVLAGQADGLGATLTSADQLVAVLDSVLEASEADLDAILASSTQVLDELAVNKEALGEGLRTLPSGVAAIARATSQGSWFQVYARGVGIVNSSVSEPVVGPNYNDAGVDDTSSTPPLLGTPYFPLPPIPETSAGPFTVNPANPHHTTSPEGSSGLAALLEGLLGGAG